MEQDDYSIFRKFTNLDHAHDIHDLLTSKGIKTVIGDNSSSLDNSFGGNHAQDELEIRIDVADFERAEAILAQHARDSLNDVPKDYYLFEFTDDELYDVLVKHDEWNEFDYLLAQKILEDRGKPVDEEHLDNLRQERIELLAQPDKDQQGWIIAGYIFSILGGFLGLIIGYFLWTSRKTLPNGVKVPSYSESNRKHGKYIFLIGIIILPISILMRAFNVF
jgi:hypothetical protein